MNNRFEPVEAWCSECGGEGHVSVFRYVFSYDFTRGKEFRKESLNELMVCPGCQGLFVSNRALAWRKKHAPHML